MLLSFLIPFTIALIAAVISSQSREEIVKIFSMIVMLINLLLSFAWAPWLVQLLILAGGLGGLRYFCKLHACHKVEEFH